MSTEELAERIEQLAAHIDAAQCEWLLLVAEFDAREGWGVAGILSCAHWLSWRCGIALRTAQEHVRVARRLRDLPAITAAFSKGRLSYSKVRALCRLEDVEREEELLELAKNATASQLERTVNAYCRCVRGERPDVERRFLTLGATDDGMVSVRGLLMPDEAAVLRQALDQARAAADQARAAADQARDPEHRGDDLPAVDPGGRQPTATERAVDALVALAESALAASELADRAGGARHQVVVHVDVETLAAEPAGASNRRLSAAPPRCETESGFSLAAETARRLCCDAGVVVSADRRGTALDVGRRRRSIPPALMRALRARDHGCRFPGCTRTRFVDAHHITHWAHGGSTEPGNLVLLCRHHHRLVHEGGYGVERDSDGSVRFRTPYGALLHHVPTRPRGSRHELVKVNRARGADPTPGAGAPTCGYQRLDLALAVDALFHFGRAGPP